MALVATSGVSLGAGAVTLMAGVGPDAAACVWTCAPPPRTAVLEPALCCRALRTGAAVGVRVESTLASTCASAFESKWTLLLCSRSSVGVSSEKEGEREGEREGDGEGGEGEGSAGTIMSGCAMGAASGTCVEAAAAATTLSAHVRHMCEP